jgi:hypothetical protein
MIAILFRIGLTGQIAMVMSREELKALAAKLRAAREASDWQAESSLWGIGWFVRSGSKGQKKKIRGTIHFSVDSAEFLG